MNGNMESTVISKITFEDGSLSPHSITLILSQKSVMLIENVMKNILVNGRRALAL